MTFLFAVTEYTRLLDRDSYTGSIIIFFVAVAALIFDTVVLFWSVKLTLRRYVLYCLVLLFLDALLHQDVVLDIWRRVCDYSSLLPIFRKLSV
jgi:hypothetical protein